MNPIARETLNAVRLSKAAQGLFVWYAVFGAFALFVFWPKRDLAMVLNEEFAPNTLLAVLVTLGLVQAHHALRSGNREILSDRTSVSEWIDATQLSKFTIARGVVLAELFQVVFIAVLFAPLLLAAYAISAESLGELCWGVATGCAQALFYALLGGVLNLFLAEREVAPYLISRTALVVGYLATPFVLPVASHFVSVYELTGGGAQAAHATPKHIVFTATYALGALALAGVLWRKLEHEAQHQ